MNTKITHAPHGDHVLMTVTLDGSTLTARDDGAVDITMLDDDWRETARDVVKEFNAIEQNADPDALVARIHHALANACERQPLPPHVDAKRRAVSSVLHRLADFVTSGSISTFDITGTKNGAVHVAATTKHGKLVTYVVGFQMERAA